MSRVELRDAPQADPAAAAKPVFRMFSATLHFLTYHLFLKRRRTIETYAAGFRFVVPPTVFHPSVFKTGEYFAEFISGLDLHGQRVADVGTGSGILALAAARAGAGRVVALDINPKAAWAARENARLNGVGDRVDCVCSNLLSALNDRPLFDVIVSNPPYFPGEPRDLADRAWHSGPNHRDIVQLFEQARARIAPGGRMYLLVSTRSDLALIGTLIKQARMKERLVSERSILIDSFVIYELQPV